MTPIICIVNTTQTQQLQLQNITRQALFLCLGKYDGKILAHFP